METAINPIDAEIENALISKADAESIAQDFSQFLSQVEEWKSQLQKIKVESIHDKAEMQEAKELRLKIREARMAIEENHKKWKRDVIDRGKFIDGCKNVGIGLLKPLEEECKAKEEFAKRLEEERIAKLKDERVKKLAKYSSEIVLDVPGNLADLSNADFDDLLAGRKARFEKEQAEKKAEEEALAKKAEEEALEKQKLKEENEALKQELQERFPNIEVLAVGDELEVTPDQHMRISELRKLLPVLEYRDGASFSKEMKEEIFEECSEWIAFLEGIKKQIGEEI